MAENRYPCPECGAVLKPAKELAPGKKLRCPKCDHVFAPVPAETAKAAVKKPKIDDEDDGPSTYGVSEDEDKADEATKEERKKAMGPLKDRRPKSARGPAQAIVTKPSNQLLATATMFCVSSVISIVIILWPLVFALERKPDDDAPAHAPKVKVLSPEEKKARAIQGAVVIAFAVLAFCYNGFIAAGAVKMQALESYAMAMLGSILILLPFEWGFAYPAFYWFIRLVIGIAGEEYFWHFHLLTIATIGGWGVYVGIWNMMTLRKPEVLAGFQEEEPKD